MLILNPLDASERSVLVGYAVAVLTVAAALAVLFLMQTRWQASAPVSLLLVAVIATTWLAGTKPGVLATALAILGFDYYYLGLGTWSDSAPIQAIRLLSFAALACYVVWITATERGAAESLRRAHDGLQRANEALRVENVEHRRTEEQLRLSEAKFRALAESASAAIFIHRGDRISYANPAASSITGYSREELCAMGLSNTGHPDFQGLLEARALARQKGELVPGRFELKIVTKAAQERWLDLTEGVFEFEGAPAVVSIAFDITERQRVEEALRKSERLLREAEELGHTGSWEHDLVTGRIVNTPENIRLFFGDDDSKGARLEDYIEAVHPDDRDYLVARRQKLHTDGGPGDIEFRVIWPDGSVHVLAGRATIVRDRSGQVVRAYGTNIDITERKRAEEAVRESRQLLDSVLATLPVGVAVTDRAGDIVLANEASKHLWGGPIIISGRERWARSVGYWHDSGERIAPTEWASVRALSDGQTSLNELIDVDTYIGERKTIQNSTAPIRNVEGQIVGAVIVNQDVTERVHAEEALHESANRLQHLSRRLLAVQEEERRHLSRELHDEFGQLLASITLHLHAARRVAGEAVQAALDECMALLHHAAEQVRTLALELRPRMLETAGLDATLRWLAEQHQQRTGIATEVVGQLADVSSEVSIACFRVAQEALTNVARHARAQHVWVELDQSDGVLELTIRDDGAGFDVARAFELAGSRGSLGLLGMQERAEILGGTLEVHSEAGRGTRIRISLPFAAAVAASAERAA
jgi:PAS domain S-box-containing protein